MNAVMLGSLGTLPAGRAADAHTAGGRRHGRRTALRSSPGDAGRGTTRPRGAAGLRGPSPDRTRRPSPDIEEPVTRATSRPAGNPRASRQQTSNRQTCRRSPRPCGHPKPPTRRSEHRRGKPSQTTRRHQAPNQPANACSSQTDRRGSLGAMVRGETSLGFSSASLGMTSSRRASFSASLATTAQASHPDPRPRPAFR